MQISHDCILELNLFVRVVHLGTPLLFSTHIRNFGTLFRSGQILRQTGVSIGRLERAVWHSFTTKNHIGVDGSSPFDKWTATRLWGLARLCAHLFGVQKAYHLSKVFFHSLSRLN